MASGQADSITDFDAIIAGQGTAGTTLAWHLIDRGLRVLILDPGAPVTASRIAAGLMTPITGQRNVVTEEFEHFLTAASAFYRRTEARTGTRFFFERDAVRLFQNEREQRAFSRRALRPDYRRFLLSPQPEPLLPPGLADTSGGGFAMRSAQLDVPGYLAASRAALDVRTLEIDWREDVTFDRQRVRVGGWSARWLISCEGYAASRNPFFSWIPFNAAKGDILTVRFEGPLPPLSLHKGIWLAPSADPAVFRLGSTYDWSRFDEEPDPAARATLESKLKGFILRPYRVISHDAAVRPIISLSRPRLGLHPRFPQLAYFNGLGSKGSLIAPAFAEILCRHLIDLAPIPEGNDLKAYWQC